MMRFPAFKGLKFPELPKNTYRSAPIYLEPMIGSGEWITVVGVAAGVNEYLAERLISPDTAEAMYGKQGENLLGFADMIVSDLMRHLSQADITDWAPCIDGVKMGPLREARADDLRHALTQVAFAHASLCKFSALKALDEDEPENNGRDNTLSAWVKLVQDKAIAYFPDIDGHFNVQETLADGDKITLHFARNELAVNIGLITTSRLNPRANDTKIKLWNLEHLPDRYREKRLVLGIPRDDAPDLADIKVRDKVQSKIEALIKEAENSRITLQTAYDADQAVKLMVA